MAQSTSHTVIRRFMQFELRRLLEWAGKSQTDAANRLDTTKARIGHFETGRNLPRLPDVEVLLPFYGAADQVETFKELILQARATTAPTFGLDPMLELAEGFSLYVGLEQGASQIFTYDAILIMGILQCRNYATATVRGHLGADVSDDHVAELVDLRMRRQVALD